MRRGTRDERAVRNQSSSQRSRRSRGRIAQNTSLPGRRSARLNPYPREENIERGTESAPIRERRRWVTRRRIQDPHRPAAVSESGIDSARDTDVMPYAGNSYDGSQSFSVEIAVQPPSIAETGIPLYPPPVVRVHKYDHYGNEVSGEEDLSNLFVQATLYPETGRPPSLAPPDMFLLSGRLSMSLELLNDPSPGGLSNGTSPRDLQSIQGSYAIFPDLRINRPGRYKLGVSLFRVGDGSRLQSAMPNGGSSRAGGTSLLEAKTTVISVENGYIPSPQLDYATYSFLEHLRNNRGANIPSPPRRR